MKPHCYAQAACFVPTCATCGKCSVAIDCAQQVLEHLMTIHESLDVADMMTDTRRFLDKRGVDTSRFQFLEATSDTCGFEVEIDLSQCGQRSQKIAKAILTRGIDIRADIRRGVNHLTTVKPAHLALVQDVLARQGSITHQHIKQLVMQTSPHSKPTSVSNSASWTAKALQAMGVIELYGERYVLID